MGTRVIPAAPAATEAVATGRSPTDRLEAVDLLRGVVIVIMALDHVRDFLSERIAHVDTVDPTDLAKTTAAIFLTRWITHYCAPTFMFLAGTGAFLYGSRGRSKPELAWFLFSRGLWLAFLELTVIRASWWFNWSPYEHGVGVFWAIGWSMVVLSVLVFLPTMVVTVFGVVMIASHNLLDSLTAAQVHLPGWLWIVLHRPGKDYVVEGITFETGYCLIPWMGVMAVGYGFGTQLLLPPAIRRRRLWLLGAALTLGFIILRAVNVYGDASPWMEQPRDGYLYLSFLNCTKYPPSLLYLLMTLGPAILALALFDRPLGPLARPIITFGRVPLFFYLLHIPLIHGLAVVIDWWRFGWSPQATNGPWGLLQLPPDQVPSGYGVSLPMVYLIWVGVLLVLYPPCWWFAEVKRRHKSPWLSYL
jgi:uncharacterized membrane protein